MIWTPSHRAHTPARLLADRHYSRQKPGSPQFMPPASCRVLVADNHKAVFGLSFPIADYVKHAWAGAWIISILVKGFCFKKAGFRAVGETKKGLIAWQLLPHDMPPAREFTRKAVA